jgi:hypothetical protein
LDTVAEELEVELLQQGPTDDQLSEGFLVAFDNGFATPLATEENLRNSGLLSFLAGRPNVEVAPRPESPPPVAEEVRASDVTIESATVANPHRPRARGVPTSGVLAGIAIAVLVWLAKYLTRKRLHS